MRLVREWNGTAHVVTVGEDGVIRWNGRHWNSLSEVARAITDSGFSGYAAIEFEGWEDCLLGCERGIANAKSLFA